MIRQANEKDLDQLMQIYHDAKEFMIRQNNPNQWDKGYPSRELIREDIRKKQMYLLEEDGILQGCFVYIIGPDPYYAEIEGAWLNTISMAPFIVLHLQEKVRDLGGML